MPESIWKLKSQKLLYTMSSIWSLTQPRFRRMHLWPLQSQAQLHIDSFLKYWGMAIKYNKNIYFSLKKKNLEIYCTKQVCGFA